MLEGLRAVSPMLLAHNRVRDLAACSLVYRLGTCPSSHLCWAELSPVLRFGAQQQQSSNSPVVPLWEASAGLHVIRGLALVF